MSKPSRLVSIILFLVLILSACNLPPNTQEETGSASAVLTAAAQTVEVSLTQSAAQNTPTVAVLPTSTIAPPTVTLAVASPTINVPAATATQDCDNGDFVTDVTIPDGTVLDPNETFTKTWRLKNSGTCSWTPSYAVVFSNGDFMSGPSTQALTGNVNPGQTMDLSVDLKAPATPGDYTGYWKLRNAAGVTFATFYVTIKVSGGGPFAVTSVTYSVSTFSEGTYVQLSKGHCQHYHEWCWYCNLRLEMVRWREHPFREYNFCIRRYQISRTNLEAWLWRLRHRLLDWYLH